jgi:hypothetical protein
LPAADGRLRSLAWKVFGAPPAKGAPRVQLLRWIRAVQLRALPFALIAYVMLLVWAAQTWVLVTAAVGGLISLESVVSLSVRNPPRGASRARLAGASAPQQHRCTQARQSM